MVLASLWSIRRTSQLHWPEGVLDSGIHVEGFRHDVPRKHEPVHRLWGAKRRAIIPSGVFHVDVSAKHC